MKQNPYQECIEICLECMNACNYCYVSSLKEYDLAMLRECIRINRECAAICMFAAEAISRDTMFAAGICGLCAKVCDACVEECGKHEHGHCQKCADVCQKCAEVCRRIAAA